MPRIVQDVCATLPSTRWEGIARGPWAPLNDEAPDLLGWGLFSLVDCSQTFLNIVLVWSTRPAPMTSAT